MTFLLVTKGGFKNNVEGGEGRGINELKKPRV